MLTRAAFVERYPEFAQANATDAGAAAIEAVLVEAEEQTDPDIFGDKTDAAHGTLTAHILTMNPRGRESKLQKADLKKTVYGLERERLESLVGGFQGGAV
jgi:hypothetical protein